MSEPSPVETVAESALMGAETAVIRQIVVICSMATACWAPCAIAARSTDDSPDYSASCRPWKTRLPTIESRAVVHSRVLAKSYQKTNHWFFLGGASKMVGWSPIASKKPKVGLLVQ
jgi:hypothetical protein